MKHKISIVLSLLTLLSSLSVTAQVRKNFDISDNWKFKREDFAKAEGTSFNDVDWQSVWLPHTWNNLDGQDGGNDYYRGIGWYRKSLNIPSAFDGKRIYLKFNAANCKADLYVNGTLAGTHTGSYAAFAFDITPFVLFGGKNIVAVKVDNSSSIRVPPLSADFTFFGGLTRTAEMLVLDQANISPLLSGSPGVFITQQNVSNASATVTVSTKVDNNAPVVSDLRLTAKLRTREGKVIDKKTKTLRIDGGGSEMVEQRFSVKKPHLWNGKNDPYLYNVLVEVYRKNVKTDSVVQPLGLRYYSVDKDSGFYLNGKKYPLHGVAYHEDRRDKGRALSLEDRKQDMDILTELGCTYIRLSHYQHDQFIYRYCDEHGIIVWTEIPVINNIDTTSALFADNAKQQLTELIRQNYNHPSVCFWGVFNEVDYKPGPNPAPLIRELNDLAHHLDSTRLTTAAAMFDDRPQHWMPDVISWNKYFGWYVGTIDDFGGWLDTMHKKHPDSKIGVSEYGVGANTQDHSPNPRQPNPGGQFHPEEYQNLYHERHWREIERHPFLYATAVWIAFDFSSDGRNEGKNPGVNDKGLVTQDRKIKKDAYYFYKANWNSEPMVYISSRRFTQRTEANCEVKVYSNCESVELLINGKNYSTVSSSDHIFRCADIMLQPGANTILATAQKNGRTFSDSCTWYLSQTK
jgi:beta-galactosidase